MKSGSNGIATFNCMYHKTLRNVQERKSEADRPPDEWMTQSLIGREPFVWVEVKKLCEEMNCIVTHSRH